MAIFKYHLCTFWRDDIREKSNAYMWELIKYASTNLTWPCFISMSVRYLIHPHVTHCSFMLFDLVVSEKKLSLILYNFYRHFNSTSFQSVIRVHLISYQFVFQFFISMFLWRMLACLHVTLQVARSEEVAWNELSDGDPGSRQMRKVTVRFQRHIVVKRCRYLVQTVNVNACTQFNAPSFQKVRLYWPAMK
jgi:hypothetical protein